VRTKSFHTEGGSLTVSCSGRTASLLSWSPASGFGVKDARSGGKEARVEFRSDDVEVRARVRCVDGVPSARIQRKD
jgi:hypothetical protein